VVSTYAWLRGSSSNSVERGVRRWPVQLREASPYCQVAARVPRRIGSLPASARLEPLGALVVEALAPWRPEAPGEGVARRALGRHLDDSSPHGLTIRCRTSPPRRCDHAPQRSSSVGPPCLV